MENIRHSEVIFLFSESPFISHSACYWQMGLIKVPLFSRHAMPQLSTKGIEHVLNEPLISTTVLLSTDYSFDVLTLY